MSDIDELRAIGDFDTLAFCQRFIAALEEENSRLENRIGELVPQCDSAYAPYRQMVMDARAEVDKFSTEIDTANKTIQSQEKSNAEQIKELLDTRAELAAAQAREARLRAVLEWYADYDNNYNEDGAPFDDEAGELDYGLKARAALAEKP